MKRNIALLACVLALTACGNQSSSDNDQSGNANGDSSGSNTSQSSDQSSNQAADQNGDQNGDQAADQSTDQTGDQSSGDQAANQNTDQTGDQASDQTSTDQSSAEFAGKNAKRSYALGMDIGNSLKGLPMDVDLDQLSQGVRDVVDGNETKLSQDQLPQVMQGVVSDMEAAQKKKQEQQSAANLKAGEEFLAQNKNKGGVKTLKDGLQYKVVKQGDGPQPDANDSVSVHYTGKLIDGTVFDSSEGRDKPVTFPVNAVIPGWTEALQLMHVGGEYALFIPPDLAYGERGAGAQIGPNETLIFDVKLVSVDKNKGKGNDDDNSQSEAGSSSNGASKPEADSGSDSSDSGAAKPEANSDGDSSDGDAAKPDADSGSDSSDNGNKASNAVTDSGSDDNSGQ